MTRVTLGKPPRYTSGGGEFQDHYYLLKDLYTVAGLADCRGWLEEGYEYDTYGHVTIQEWPYGDVNRDGTKNNIDKSMVQSLSGQREPMGDVNLDGIVNNTDVSMMNSIPSASLLALTYSSVDNPYFFTGRLTDTLHASSLFVESPGSCALPECEEPIEGVHYDPDFRRIQDNRNRVYDPKHGRWLQRDPLGVRPYPPRGEITPHKQYMDSMELYGYVKSRPTDAGDPAGLFSRDQHIGITADGFADTGMTFVREGTLERIQRHNWRVDLKHFFTPSWHAQNVEWVPLVQGMLEDLKVADCCPDPRMPIYDTGRDYASVLRIMGEALHILQDFYAHTDWVEGVNMIPVYQYYDDIIVLDSVNAPNDGIVWLGSASESDFRVSYSGVLHYEGWLPGSRHSRYATDAPGSGRDSAPPAGLTGAFSRARSAATRQTEALFNWARYHMSRSCCLQIFGYDDCRRYSRVRPAP